MSLYRVLYMSLYRVLYMSLYRVLHMYIHNDTIELKQLKVSYMYFEKLKKTQ